MKLTKIICLAATAAVLTACARSAGNSSFHPDSPALYLTSEGVITSADIETYENDYYTEEELKTSVTEAIASFGGAVAINTCTLADGEARLLLDFNDPSAYMEFIKTYPDESSPIQIKTMDIVSVPDAITKGYLVGTAFKKPNSDGKTIASDEVTKQSKLYVAAIEGPALIQTDGAIQYVSEEITMNGNMAQTPETGVSYIVFK